MTPPFDLESFAGLKRGQEVRELSRLDDSAESQRRVRVDVLHALDGSTGQLRTAAAVSRHTAVRTHGVRLDDSDQ